MSFPIPIRLWLFIPLLLLVSFIKPVAAETVVPKKTVCLNMIIKDESSVIERCLKSVKPLIDYWVIVDTGSTDGTQSIVKEFMKDVPGELHERVWKNFAHNRNEALELARKKGDYVLFIDADEIFEYPSEYRFPPLEKDVYYMTTLYGGLSYPRLRLLKTSTHSSWKGALHEAIVIATPHTSDTLATIVNTVYTDGARSKDPAKFEKDALLLEKELKEDPHNTRTVFYLAQSYRDAGKHAEAIKYYQQRVDMKGWDLEVFWSMLQIAKLQELVGEKDEIVNASYYRAYHHSPGRSEPLYYLAQKARFQNNYALCYALSSMGIGLQEPINALFVEKWIYDYGLKLEKSIAAYWLGRFNECEQLSEEMLAQNIPLNVRECVERNLKFAQEKIKE